MLRFAFKPRHPVTRVAFTADGREIVTAQPNTSVAIRDRLTGTARVTFPIRKSSVIYELAVRQDAEWIGVRSAAGIHLVGPHWPSAGFAPPCYNTTGFGTTTGSTAVISWVNNPTPVFWELDLANPLGIAGLIRRSEDAVTIHTTGRMQAVSPDTAFALCLRPQTRPILASLRTGELVAEVTSPIRLRHATTGYIIAFSPDGTKLALGEGESLSVFELSAVPREMPEGGKRKILHPLLTLERPDPSRHGTHADKLAEHWLPPVAFDHAGRSLFTLGLRNRVQRIDLTTGGVMCEWGWRCEPIRSLAVSPDDLTAAAGCQRGELVLWDLE